MSALTVNFNSIINLSDEQFFQLCQQNELIRFERLETRKVEIYRPNQEVEVLECPATLSGEKVLPGFVLNLDSIW